MANHVMSKGKKIKLKDCKVNLKRLSRATIESYLKQKDIDITHNISGTIKGCELKIGGASIRSKDLAFDVKIKIRKDAIIITQSESRAPSSLPKNCAEKSNLTVAVLQPKPITKLIDEAWRQSKLNRRGEFHVNDIVLAKLKGHAAWPAKIMEFSTKNKTKVFFFGANANENIGFVNTTEIVHFVDSINVARLTLKRDFVQRRKFEKGIREVEIILAIPSCASFFKD